MSENDLLLLLSVGRAGQGRGEREDSRLCERRAGKQWEESESQQAVSRRQREREKEREAQQTGCSASVNLFWSAPRARSLGKKRT